MPDETNVQTCPRRMNEMGPWDSKEALDRWESDRWGARESDRWPSDFAKPRACSFCGGVNPDDAISLIEAGWEVEGTTKGYKRYLHPPGQAAEVEVLIGRIRRGELDSPRPHAAPQHVDPTPPVKLYVMHFDQEQIERFNAALKGREVCGA